MDREQNIHYSMVRRVGANYTLSGQLIRGGFAITIGVGGPEFFGCGCEKAPGIDTCSCGR